jgi:hypothetical protein
VFLCSRLLSARPEPRVVCFVLFLVVLGFKLRDSCWSGRQYLMLASLHLLSPVGLSLAVGKDLTPGRNSIGRAGSLEPPGISAGLQSYADRDGLRRTPKEPEQSRW